MTVKSKQKLISRSKNVLEALRPVVAAAAVVVPHLITLIRASIGNTVKNENEKRKKDTRKNVNEKHPLLHLPKMNEK